MGKEVIVIDLNPLSRSAQQATITIVDELSRALGNMLDFAASEGTLEVDSDYNHITVLEEGVNEMLNAFKRTWNQRSLSLSANRFAMLIPTSEQEVVPPRS